MGDISLKGAERDRTRGTIGIKGLLITGALGLSSRPDRTECTFTLRADADLLANKLLSDTLRRCEIGPFINKGVVVDFTTSSSSCTGSDCILSKQGFWRAEKLLNNAGLSKLYKTGSL